MIGMLKQSLIVSLWFDVLANLCEDKFEERYYEISHDDCKKERQMPFHFQMTAHSPIGDAIEPWH